VIGASRVTGSMGCKGGARAAAIAQDATKKDAFILPTMILRFIQVEAKSICPLNARGRDRMLSGSRPVLKMLGHIFGQDLNGGGWTQRGWTSPLASVRKTSKLARHRFFVSET